MTFSTPYWTKWQHHEETVVAKVQFCNPRLCSLFLVMWQFLQKSCTHWRFPLDCICSSHLWLDKMAVLHCILASFLCTRVENEPTLELVFSYYLTSISPWPDSSLAAHYLMFMADFDNPYGWHCLVPHRVTPHIRLHCHIAQLLSSSHSWRPWA